MRTHHLFAVFCMLALLLPSARAWAQTEEKPDRWAEAMDAFAKQDAAEKQPKTGGVVLVGSSSIRFWDVKKSFVGMKQLPLNRGFGGSQIADSVKHADLLIIKHKPRVVVFYAGDNDIKGGHSPEQVTNDFQALVDKIAESLPETKVIFISIKPSPSRWALAEQMQDANHRIAAICAENEQLRFVDVWEPMLGKDGKPRPELYRKDGLHMTEEGYKIWTALVRPHLKVKRPAPATAN